MAEIVDIAAARANTGHGHVSPRPDGVKARCGGPGICAMCSQEMAKKLAPPTDFPTISMRRIDEYEALIDG